MPKSTILHHGSCPDGFGAAWVAHRTWFPADNIWGCNYNDDPPWDLIDDAVIAVLDFCFETRLLDEMAERARTLLVVDHHQTAKAWLEASTLTALASPADLIDLIEQGPPGWTSPSPGANYILDQDHSGIMLSAMIAEELGHTSPHPGLGRIVDAIEDRDLWRFQKPDTAEIFAAVTSRPYTIEAWDEMLVEGPDALIIEGRAIQRYRDQLVEQVNADDRVFWLALGDKCIPCTSSPYAIGSDVAGRLAEDYDGIGAYAIWSRDNVQIGLRSRDDGPDVAALAELYEGGGHLHASGLRLSHADFAERCTATPF